MQFVLFQRARLGRSLGFLAITSSSCPSGPGVRPPLRLEGGAWSLEDRALPGAEGYIPA